MRLLVLCAVVTFSCNRDAPRGVEEVKRDPTPPAPSTTATPPPRSRVRGDLDGEMTLANAHVVSGEPIVITLEVRPRTAPLRVFIGGDMRNAANYPLRFSVRATDASGAVVCDLVEKPPFPSFGGTGSERVFKPGEPWRERVVLNAACPALAKPGRYQVTVHRRITTLGMTYESDATVYSCDAVPVHEEPPALDPQCLALLAAAPSVTTDFVIEVAPYDAAVARERTATLLMETASAPSPDALLRHRIERYVCGTLTCACPKTTPVSDADLLASIGPSPAPGFPGFCP